MKEYDKDFDCFHANNGESITNIKNEFVAVKNLKVCHEANSFKLLELPRADGFDDTDHTFIEFVK